MLVYADRVKQTTITEGTGTFSLDASIPAGFQGFVAGLGDGSYCQYCCVGGSEWEVGVGLVTDAATDTLTRATILASSNGGSAVSFSAGTKTIFCTRPAAVLNGGVIEFYPGNAILPSTNFPTYDTRNNHAVLDFDDTAVEYCYFEGMIPDGYSGTGCTIEVLFSAATATSGTVGWYMYFESLDGLDIDGDSFAPEIDLRASVSGTCGIISIATPILTVTHSSIDSPVANKKFRIKLARNTAVASDAGGDAELHCIRITF